MPRRLDVIHRLLREPCPVDPSTLPRNARGFDCASCGRTVVDVAGLTFEEAVEFRQRARGGPERICGAYTVDREERVLLRASPGSSAVVAVAVSVLLAACETHAPTGAEASVRVQTAPVESTANARLQGADPAPSAPVAVGSASTQAVTSRASPSESAQGVNEPPCRTPRTSSAARSSQHGARRNAKDLQVLAGY
jgi:hypothetical protein